MYISVVAHKQLPEELSPQGPSTYLLLPAINQLRLFSSVNFVTSRMS